MMSVFLSCQPGKEEKGKEIILTNTSPVDLTNKAIALERSKLDMPDNNLFPLLLTQNGDTVASQMDDIDNDGQWDELFFVADIKANDSLALKFSWINSQPEYTKRTSVRFGKRDSEDTPVYAKTSDTLYASEIHMRLGYQPFQTDGPTWENDKAGFRHYFDGRNSKDLFGKTVEYMTPEDVGINAEGAVEDNYHVMTDWGRDILGVGNSAGLGGIEMMIGNKIVRLGNMAGDTATNFGNAVFEIIEEGPVRSIVKFTYNQWSPQENRDYTVEEKISIWPGMYAYKNSVKVSGLQGDETLLIGLVNSNTKEPLTELDANEKYTVLYTHDKQTYDKTWWLGLALIVPKDGYLGHGETPETGPFVNSFYAKMKVNNDQLIDYFAVGAWELSDENFTDSTYFVNYVQNLADQLAIEVEVEVR